MAVDRPDKNKDFETELQQKVLYQEEEISTRRSNQVELEAECKVLQG